MNGISTCDYCSQVFTTSLYHKTLSASWVVRNWYIYDTKILKDKFGYCDEILEIIDNYVIEQGLSHDEFLKVMAEEKTTLDLIA